MSELVPIPDKYAAIGMEIIPPMGDVFDDLSKNPLRYSPYILAQSAVASGVAPSGSVGANGALTLGTALGATYAAGIYLNFPAGAVYAGSVAGSYWCVMSSTTVGTVYNNTRGLLSVYPSTLVPIVDAGPGAFTGAGTTSKNLLTAAVPANALGPNGQLRINWEFSYNTTAGTKNIALIFGGTSMTTAVRTSSGGHDSYTHRIKNRGLPTLNSFFQLGESSTSSTNAFTFPNIDTTQDQNILVNVSTPSAATDWAILDSYCIEVLPG